ncbi:hypothetical protein Syun_018564 [Stephania yunnanensis]|uniref:Uncharacterized protein n=1 Tax=Stephania yunnanensis TaxID=152371 RepID=A0AAP0IUE1_9MAGN
MIVSPIIETIDQIFPPTTKINEFNIISSNQTLTQQSTRRFIIDLSIDQSTQSTNR